jgi:hypothetical protein
MTTERPIYEVLAEKLGREPSADEFIAEVTRIFMEALADANQKYRRKHGEPNDG